jgi:hypothetical protein
MRNPVNQPGYQSGSPESNFLSVILLDGADREFGIRCNSRHLDLKFMLKCAPPGRQDETRVVSSQANQYRQAPARTYRPRFGGRVQNTHFR